MILDYAYNKKERDLSISYVQDNGQKGILKFNVDKFKSYGPSFNGPYKNWDGRRCDIKWVLDPDKFDIKTYMEEQLSEKNKKKLLGKVAPALYTWDIEVVSDEFPEPSEAKYPVVTISVCSPNCDVRIFGTRDLGENGDEYLSAQFNKYMEKFSYFQKLNMPMPTIKYIKFDSEREMIEYFLVNIVAKVPVLAGWNSMLFDWQYIQNRCNILGINLKLSSFNGLTEYKNYTDLADNKVKLQIPRHTVVLDMMDVIATHDYVVMPIKEALSLDYIASESMGVNKIQYEGTLKDLYYNDYQKYVYYNAIDSVLVQCIDKRFKTLQNIYTQALYCKERIGATFSKIAVSEALVFNYFYENGIKVIPNRNKDVQRGELQGAYVRIPTPGKHKYVCCNDFASLYPSTIITCNLSFENFLGSNFTEEEIENFRKDPNYFVSVTGQVYKNDKDYAFKVIQSTLKSNRNTAKYLAKGLEAEVVYDIDQILSGNTVNIKNYSEDKIKAIAEIGYNVSNTNDLKLIDDLQEFRRKLKTEIEFYTSYEQAMKLLGNSMYGGSSHVSFFWFNMAMANDITGEARNIIHLMEHHIPEFIRKEWPYMTDVHKQLGITVDPEKAEKILRDSKEESFVKVIYGDTDSLYISYNQLVKSIDNYENMSSAELGKIVVEFNTGFLDAHNREIMNQHYIERHVKSVQNFELETLALAGVWLNVKKRYAQVLLWKDGRTFNQKDGKLPMKAKGLEMIKAAYPKQAREGLTRLIRQLLEDDDEQYMLQKLNISVQKEKQAYFSADIDDICGSVKVNNYNKYIINDNDPYVLYTAPKCPYNARALGNYNRIRKAHNLPGDPIYGGKLKWFIYCPQGSTNKDNLDYFAYPMKNYPKWADKYAPIAKNVMFQKQLLDPFNRIIVAIGLGMLTSDGSMQQCLTLF